MRAAISRLLLVERALHLLRDAQQALDLDQSDSPELLGRLHIQTLSGGPSCMARSYVSISLFISLFWALNRLAGIDLGLL